MADVQVIHRSTADHFRRAVLAGSVLMVFTLIGNLVSLVLGLVWDQQLEAAIPHLSAEGDARGVTSFIRAAFPLSTFLVGLVGALVVWDPKITPRTEAAGLIIALLVVASTWSTDIIMPISDSLYSVRALVIFEFIGAAFAIAALVLVFRWNTDRPTLIGIKAITIFIITGFLIVAPLMLATNYFLVKFKIPIPMNPESWEGAIGGLLSLAVSLVGLGRKSTSI